MSSEIKPLLDALPFIKFTDRAIGNAFVKALQELDIDLTSEEYEPDPGAEAAYARLHEEIQDAILNQDEPEPTKPTEDVVLKESDLPEAEPEPELQTIELENENEAEA